MFKSAYISCNPCIWTVHTERAMHMRAHYVIMNWICATISCDYRQQTMENSFECIWHWQILIWKSLEEFINAVPHWIKCFHAQMIECDIIWQFDASKNGKTMLVTKRTGVYVKHNCVILIPSCCICASNWIRGKINRTSENHFAEWWMMNDTTENNVKVTHMPTQSWVANLYIVKRMYYSNDQNVLSKCKTSSNFEFVAFPNSHNTH